MKRTGWDGSLWRVAEQIIITSRNRKTGQTVESRQPQTVREEFRNSLYVWESDVDIIWGPQENAPGHHAD
jgi:hypothetical protein